MPRILLLLGVLFIGVLVLSCSDDDDELTSEEFVGVYLADDDSTLLQETPGELYDSVILVVSRNVEYTIFFYDYNSADNKNFCNTNGQVDGFGSNSITFYPSFIDTGGCDTLRVPKGLFGGDFTTNGDTIYISQYNLTDVTGNPLPYSVHRFILLKN